MRIMPMVRTEVATLRQEIVKTSSINTEAVLPLLDSISALCTYIEISGQYFKGDKTLLYKTKDNLSLTVKVLK